MNNIESQILALSIRLKQLEANHNAVFKDIVALKRELEELQNASAQSDTAYSTVVEEPTVVPVQNAEVIQNFLNKTGGNAQSKPEKKNNNLEAFIGENVISKIGIIITIIGAVIGTKYSIEHDLITPQMRLILGMGLGLGLLGLGLKLKSKYDLYSAVLSSGALAILYFSVFAAYNYYGFIAQTWAFVFMLIITSGGVYLALWHNKQVIAHIGLVGAYAVPLLLSDGSGNIGFLFAFTTLVNAGILAIAYAKNWRQLRFTSFAFTWLIFIVWFVDKYNSNNHEGLALLFLVSNFLIFYASILIFKLKKLEAFDKQDVGLILTNTFVFFGLFYATIESNPIGEKFLGLLTILVAMVQLGAAFAVYKRKLADNSLFQFLIGLSITFVVLAGPIQFDGHWVTLLWTGQAVALFYVGRKQEKPFYEQLAYPMMLFASLSMFQDWAEYSQLRPSKNGYTLLNINFVTSIVFASAFAFIVYLQKTIKTLLVTNSEYKYKFQTYLAPLVLLLAGFVTFRIELSQYWSEMIHYADSHYDMMNFKQLKTIWEVNYNVLYCVVLIALNIKRIQSKELSLVTIGVGLFSALMFLVLGLYGVSELREAFLSEPIGNRKFGLIGVRYISLMFFASLTMALYQYRKTNLLDFKLETGFGIAFHIALIWILSSELLHWLDVAEVANSYKLWLSILWGVYSLSLIVFGILRGKKMLRIIAISLFGITLVKLFVYDIAHHNSISKTIVFISLGVLLLVISYLYNKFKSRISEENETLEDKNT